MASFQLRPETKRRLKTIRSQARKDALRLKSRSNLNVEALESRTLLSSFRSIDGSGNNLGHPAWGQAGTALLRIEPVVHYADGISSPALPGNPSARYISNALSDQTDPSNPSQDLSILDSRGMSDFGYVFGQFLDHDIDLTGGGGAEFDILANQSGDPFNPPGIIPFTRSEIVAGTGTSTANPRQQPNDITSYIDLSMVYGSDATRAGLLRSHVGGLLLTSPGNLLPLNNSTYFGAAAPLAMANDAGIVPNTSLFAAGDVRANENIELTSMQTLLMRNHNRLAAEIVAAYPSLSDETIYQVARAINIAEFEAIVYNQYLPDLLGTNAIPNYHGYNSNANAGTATEFSTVLFRVFHSALDNDISRDNNNGTPIADGSVDLATAFFNPTLINPAGVSDPFSGHISTDIDPILKGAADGVMQSVDLKAVRDIRNLLFGPPGSGGSDLIARDIQRARDHGIGTYNQVRVAYGLRAVTRFSQISSNPAVQAALQAEYGTVANIDPFIGALAEDHVPGASVGPLTRAALIDQFTRFRDGDRFFYLNQFDSFTISILNQTTLAGIIMANTGLTGLASDVFFFPNQGNPAPTPLVATLPLTNLLKDLGINPTVTGSSTGVIKPLVINATAPGASAVTTVSTVTRNPVAPPFTQTQQLQATSNAAASVRATGKGTDGDLLAVDNLFASL
jgi:peroxidase